VNNRLHWRMLVIALVPVSLVSIGLSLTILNIGFTDLRDALDRHSTAQVNQFAGAVEFPLVSGDRESLTNLARKLLENDADAEAAAIFDRSGKVLVLLGHIPENAANMDANTGQLSRVGDTSVLVRNVRVPNLPMDDYYNAKDTAPAAESLGKVVLVISHQRLNEQRNAQLRFAALLTLIGTALGALLAFGLANGIRQMLANATNVVTMIGRGRLDARMEVNSANVLVDLAEGINQMARRVAWSHQDLANAVDAATAQISAERDLANRATQAKTRFLASASHDLRQPIQALALFTEQALEPQSPAEQTVLLNRISISVTQLRELLDSLLDLSRLETGEAVPQREHFRLDDRIQMTCDSLAHLATNKGLRLRYRLNPIEIFCDPHLLDRILLNLVGNAIRYTHQGGVLVTCRRYRGKVRVQVWDSGIGIAEESQTEIFNDYVQLANRERSQAKGLGLGLPICRLAAGLLDSEVHVRSRIGRGSVFWLDLALATTTSSEVVATPSEGKSKRTVSAFISTAAEPIRECCVVFDSDELRGRATAAVLRPLFGRVELATSGDRCLALGAEMRLDVVVCECSHENIGSRHRFMAIVREQAPTIRRVVLSNGLDPAQRAILTDDGLIVLEMPIQPARLRAALQANHLDSAS
jgi:two-component system, sensor histidine kinase